MGIIMSIFEKCGCKWKCNDEYWKNISCSSKCFDMEPYTDYSSSEKKITILEQKTIQLEQYCTEIDENNKRLHNKCVQLEERDNMREKNTQKILVDMSLLTKTIESLEQNIRTIHLEKTENFENDFIVIT
jgi:hypothetical protein